MGVSLPLEVMASPSFALQELVGHHTVCGRIAPRRIRQRPLDAMGQRDKSFLSKTEMLRFPISNRSGD